MSLYQLLLVIFLSAIFFSFRKKSSKTVRIIARIIVIVVISFFLAAYFTLKREINHLNSNKKEDVYQNSNNALSCNDPDSSEFSFPITGTPYPNTPAKACFDGRDVTDWVTGDEGAKLTSVVRLPGKEFFYVTSYNESKDESKIIRVFQLANGGPERNVLLKDRVGKDLKLEDELFQMRLSGYDEDNGIVYISTPTWAQSDAIHAFVVPVDTATLLTGNVKVKFITDGSFEWPVSRDDCEKCLVVSKIKHDEQGAYFPGVLVSFDGKEKCIVENQRTGWMLSPKCIPDIPSNRTR